MLCNEQNCGGKTKRLEMCLVQPQRTLVENVWINVPLPNYRIFCSFKKWLVAGSVCIDLEDASMGAGEAVGSGLCSWIHFSREDSWVRVCVAQRRAQKLHSRLFTLLTSGGWNWRQKREFYPNFHTTVLFSLFSWTCNFKSKNKVGGAWSDSLRNSSPPDVTFLFILMERAAGFVLLQIRSVAYSWCCNWFWVCSELKHIFNSYTVSPRAVGIIHLGLGWVGGGTLWMWAVPLLTHANSTYPLEGIWGGAGGAFGVCYTDYGRWCHCHLDGTGQGS